MSNRITHIEVNLMVLLVDVFARLGLSVTQSVMGFILLMLMAKLMDFSVIWLTRQMKRADEP